MINLNGQKIENAEGKNLLQIIKENGFDEKKVVAEVDEKIISKNNWESFIIKENSCIEVITFVGGG